MQAMILAAGFGTRLQPYTHFRPKPLFPVLNRPLLQILLEKLRDNGCGSMVVNCHHLAAQMQMFLATQSDVKIQFEEEILGTGGSLRQALGRFSQQPVLVMNGDIFHSVDIEAVYRHHCQSGNKVTLVLHDYPRFNTVWTEHERVVSFQPEPIAGLSLLAFTGIQVVNPEIIEMIPAGRFFHIIDLYETLVRNGTRIGMIRVDGSYWRDIGTPQDYLQLHHDLFNGLADKGSAGISPEQTWCLAEKIQLGKDVRLADWGCIGAGSTIGSGTRLKRCIVWEGVNIPAGSDYQDIIIAE